MATGFETVGQGQDLVKQYKTQYHLSSSQATALVQAVQKAAQLGFTLSPDMSDQDTAAVFAQMRAKNVTADVLTPIAQGMFPGGVPTTVSNVITAERSATQGMTPVGTPTGTVSTPTTTPITSKKEVINLLTAQGYSADIANALWKLYPGPVEGNQWGQNEWLSLAKQAQNLVDLGVTDLTQYDSLPAMQAASVSATTKNNTNVMTQLGVTQADVDAAKGMGIDLMTGGKNALAQYQTKLNEQALTTSNTNLLTQLQTTGQFNDQQLALLKELMEGQGMSLADAYTTMQAITGQSASANASPYNWAQQWQAQNPGNTSGAPAPAWLAAITPGLKAGQGIGAQGAGTAQSMPTVLSTQDWTTMPTAQKEALGGYLNWTYGSPEAVSAYANAVKRRAAPGGPTESPWGQSSWL